MLFRQWLTHAGLQIFRGSHGSVRAPACISEQLAQAAHSRMCMRSHGQLRASFPQSHGGTAPTPALCRVFPQSPADSLSRTAESRQSQGSQGPQKAVKPLQLMGLAEKSPSEVLATTHEGKAEGMNTMHVNVRGFCVNCAHLTAVSAQYVYRPSRLQPGWNIPEQASRPWIYQWLACVIDRPSWHPATSKPCRV